LVLSVTGGFVAYLFQTQVVNALISSFFIINRWDVHSLLPTENPRTTPARLVNHFDRWARGSEARWNDPKSLRNWLNYAWAQYHAAFITGWLPPLFYIFKVRDAQIADVSPWAVGLASFVFVFFALVSYAHLSRIRL